MVLLHQVQAIIAENQISIHETLPVDGKFLDFSIVKYLKLSITLI